jgi:hypothetical protein
VLCSPLGSYCDLTRLLRWQLAESVDRACCAMNTRQQVCTVLTAYYLESDCQHGSRALACVLQRHGKGTCQIQRRESDWCGAYCAPQMPDDGFASRPFQPPPPQPAPPPPRKSTKLLSIGNLDDVDATLLAGRGPSVRCAAAGVLRCFMAAAVDRNLTNFIDSTTGDVCSDERHYASHFARTQYELLNGLAVQIMAYPPINSSSL